MREVLATLDTVEQRVNAATLALQLWNPGDTLREVTVLAAAMTLEGIEA